MKRNNSLHVARHIAGGRFSTPRTLPPDCAQVEDAREKIAISKARLGTWEAVAKWYTDEHKKAAFHRLANDVTFRPSIALVEIIERKRLPPEMKLAECCPTCHVVHGDGLDCKGRPIASVVTLAPGEVVASASDVKRNGHDKPARKPDERATLHVSKATRAAIDARRKLKGLSQAEIVEKMLVAYDMLEDAL